MSDYMKTMALKILLLTNFTVLAFSVGGASAAWAEEISTTETTVGYARQTLTGVLGADYVLVPGSIQVTLRQPTIVDIGGAVRAVFGKEKVEYQVDFRVIDRSRTPFRGQIFMTIQAANSTATEPDEDNNTTLRGVDSGTNRLVKVQLFEFHNFPHPIAVQSLDLKKLTK